jgi:hypothetical protein
MPYAHVARVGAWSSSGFRRSHILAMRSRPVLNRSFHEQLTCLTRAQLTREMLRTVGAYESRFDVHFSHFVFLTPAFLNGNGALGDATRTRITMAAQTNHAIAELVARLTSLANRQSLSRSERELYRETLELIYASLPTTSLSESLIVAPQREGSILARRLGWLTTEHLLPNLKRMPCDNGLLVGCDSDLASAAGAEISIVDGAVATGATVMTILALCRPSVAKLYCVHATAHGLSALIGVARELGTDLTCIAGDVSGVLNDHFYAVTDENPNVLRVGDLGDIIAPLELATGWQAK